MSISKVRLPNNTEEDIKAKYLIQSSSSDAVSAEFSARTVTEDAIANIQKIYGNTIKWNQLCGTLPATTSPNGITYTNNGNGSITISGTATAAANTVEITGQFTSAGHKYLVFGEYLQLRKDGASLAVVNGSYIFTTVSGSSYSWRFRVGSGVSFPTPLVVWPQFFDLTAMYGAGNEPTAEEFRAQYPAVYYPYDPGSLISNSATAILSRGFNQWDEELEQYSYNQTTGEKQQSGAAVRSVNKITVIPSASYYFRAGISITFRLFLYYSNGCYKGTVTHSSGSVYQVPSDVNYIAFQLASSAYGTIYNNDICINLSDTAKNGTYEPYNGHQIDLNIPTLTGKLNGAGSSVVIFPDGMKLAGTVYDEIVGNKAIKRVGSVDLGTLTLTWSMVSNASYPNRFQTVISGIAVTGNNLIPGYTNKGLGGYGSAIDEDKSFDQASTTINVHDSSYSTAASFKTAMSGVLLYYELATPEEYILDNALQLQYPVVAGGTEMVLPTTGTAPMKMDVIYGNAADATSNLSSNFISVDSMKAFLNNLGTQMGGTWNMQYNNGKFEFTFSSS